GLDNIGVFDRSSMQLPTGGHINQADGTSWMAMYSLNLMRIALELSADNPVYQDLATKFFEHFLFIAAAMTNIGGKHINLWDEAEHHLPSLLRGHRMKRRLKRMLDETESLSPYGVRALSRYHLDHPYVFDTMGQSYTVTYQPAESDSDVFGGNSNWRGPVWMPMNYLLVESLRRFHAYYGDDFKVECPTGSGTFLTIAQIADELSRRLTRPFLK